MIAAVILLGYMILMGMAGAGPAFAEDAAEAAAEETVRIDVTVGPHGMVNGHAESYTQTAAVDAEITLALKADEGYVIGSVKVNDTDLAAEDLEGIVGAEEADLEIESSAGALNLAVAFREKGVDVATATGEIAGELGALVTDASQSVTEAVENEADDEASGTEPAGTNVGDEVGSDEVAGADEDGDEVAGTEGPEEDENGESGEDAGDEETDSGEEAGDEAGEGSDGTEEETGSGDEKGAAADDAAGADGTVSDEASADGTSEAEMASPEVSGNTSSDDASGETAAESTEGNDDAKGSDGSEPNETSDSDAAVQTGDPFSGMPLLLMALSMTMLCILGCRGVWRR